MSDLFEVIQDSVDDQKLAQAAETPTETPTETPAVEATTTEEAPVYGETPAEGTPAPTETPSLEVKSPAAKAAAAQTETVEDEFAKKHGLPPQKPGERENRLPYSAVKRIVGNAEKKAVTAALEAPTKEIETYKAKVTEYESYLEGVKRFEDVMMNDKAQFLDMLAKIPGYQEIFHSMAKGAQPQATPQAQAVAQPAEAASADEMPGPDQELSDGSKVYSLDGLRARDEWNRRQIENKLKTDFDTRLKPFEEQRKAQEYQRYLETQVIPVINNQIKEARTWAQFTENEAEIVKILQADPKISLEGAYRQVVMPKLVTDYNSMRTKVMDEIKKAPVSTSTASSITKAIPASPGKQSLEDIIRNAAGIQPPRS